MQLVRTHRRFLFPLCAVDFRRALLHDCFAFLKLRRPEPPRLIGLCHASLCHAEVHQHDRCFFVQLELTADLTKEPTHRLWLATLPTTPEPCQHPLAARLVCDPDMRDPNFV